jgi:hypothetical protein
MGANHSREDLELSDSDAEEHEEQPEQEEEDEEEENYHDANDRSSERRPKTPSSLDEVEAKLHALQLKYSSSTTTQNPNLKNAVKLYLYIGGNTPAAKWVVSDKLTSYSFVKTSRIDGDEDEDEGEDEDGDGDSVWVLRVGSKIWVEVSTEVQLKTFGDQRRVDFVAKGVWAMKFFSDEEYKSFVSKFQDCVFENTYGVEAIEENKVKLYGRTLLGG